MPKYHLCAWLTALAFALPTGLVSHVPGYWGVSPEVSDIGICWIQLKYEAEPKITGNSFLLLYIPILVTYLFALATLVVAFERLRQGISQTIMHRMKAFVLNSVNVIVYLVYWLIVLIVYAAMFDGCNASDDSVINQKRNLLNLLLFLIASKGFWSIIVWILTVDVSFGATGDKAEETNAENRLDLNSALRQEVLTFATKGIRHCAGSGSKLLPDQPMQVARLVHVTQKQDLVLSSWFAFFLILGEWW